MYQPHFQKPNAVGVSKHVGINGPTLQFQGFTKENVWPQDGGSNRAWDETA